MDSPRRGDLDVSLRNVVVRHPVKVVVALLVFVTLALFFALPEVPRPPPDPGTAVVVDAGVAVETVPAVDVLAKIEQKPVTSKKAKLLKDQMKKKLESSGKTGTNVAGAGAGVGANGGGSLDVAVVLAGDAELRRAVAKLLRGRSGLRVVDESSNAGRWLASLSMTTGEKGGAIFAKCSAAMSELPARKLVGSLGNRADVSAQGMNDDELRSAAKASCAESLADDVAKWVRSRR